MKHPHDNIRVGAITFIYSVTKRGWVFPGLSVIRNPLKAQRLAEAINNKRGCMTDFTGSNTPAEHRDSWRTPPEIFAALNAEFVFQLDAAASEKTDYVGFLSHRSRTH